MTLESECWVIAFIWALLFLWLLNTLGCLSIETATQNKISEHSRRKIKSSQLGFRRRRSWLQATWLHGCVFSCVSDWVPWNITFHFTQRRNLFWMLFMMHVHCLVLPLIFCCLLSERGKSLCLSCIKIAAYNYLKHQNYDAFCYFLFLGKKTTPSKVSCCNLAKPDYHTK